MALGALFRRGIPIVAFTTLLSLAGLHRNTGGPSLSPLATTKEKENPVLPRSVRVLVGTVDERSISRHTVTLTNQGSRAIKIVGASGTCFERGCVNAIDLPDRILPCQSVQIDFVCHVKSAGPFAFAAEIYLDVGRKKGVVVPVSFVGTVAVSE